MAMRLVGPVYLVGGQDFHRVYVDWPANDANVYLVDTGDTFVMVDCGCGDSFAGILQNVEEMDFEVRDISHVLLTHAHFPHAAAVDAAQKMVKLQVLASRECADAVRSGDLRTATFAYHREFQRCEGQVGVLEDGQSITVGAVTLTAIALPGHSPDCMGYQMVADKRHILFCGDVVRSPLLPSWRDRFGYDAQAYEKSLLKLLETPLDVLYPGHGPMCLSHGRVWVEEELRRVRSLPL